MSRGRNAPLGLSAISTNLTLLATSYLKTGRKPVSPTNHILFFMPPDEPKIGYPCQSDVSTSNNPRLERCIAGVDYKVTPLISTSPYQPISRTFFIPHSRAKAPSPSGTIMWDFGLCVAIALMEALSKES